MKPYQLIFGKQLIQHLDGRVEEGEGGVIALPLSHLTHAHFKGMTNYGKSYLLAALITLLIWQGVGVLLLDPAGELSFQVLKLLVATGYYDTYPDAYDRVLFLDAPKAHRQQRYLPFNVLGGDYDPYTAADVVLDGFKRVWPALQDGTATNIELLLRVGAAILAYHDLPLLPYLEYLYTDKNFQKRLLSDLPDDRMLKWFKDMQLEPGVKGTPEVALTTLKRQYQISFSPVVYYALAQKENVLDFAELLRENRSVLLNMKFTDPEAKRLFGCLITQQAETVAKSLDEAAIAQRKTKYAIIIDEVQNFIYQSALALESMFAEARHAGLAVWLAHQYGEQLSEELTAALSQCDIRVAFRLDFNDAFVTAKQLGFPYYPHWVKAESGDPFSLTGTRKQFYTLDEQRAIYAGWIQNLPQQEAFIRLPKGDLHRIRTITVDKVPSSERIEQIEETYLQRYFRPKDDIDREIQKTLADLSQPASVRTKSASQATVVQPEQPVLTQEPPAAQPIPAVEPPAERASPPPLPKRSKQKKPKPTILPFPDRDDEEMY